MEQGMLFGIFLFALLGWIGLVNLFAAVMHAKAIISRGEKIAGLFRGPLYVGAGVGVFLDIVFNLTLGSVIYREPPKELTFTSRCSRHKEGAGWRKDKAEWWCRELNKFDPGHC
jgi:hypothetical protein